MARKPRGQVRPPGPPGAQQHSQPPRPQVGGGSGGSWTPLRDAVRRDIEQAAAALAFASALLIIAGLLRPRSVVAVEATV